MVLKPVDTAIIMVVGPCIDNTDFKSLEESIAYNAAGMDISLIIEKTDGTSTTTAITLTTGGTSDWTHKDGGYYEVEVTAAQNAEEGIAYLRGVCTGVLPFESPKYEIVKANIYDSLIKGTDALQTDLTQIGGVIQSLTDFKDFVDSGYNSTNHRCYSDMRLMSGNSDPVINLGNFAVNCYDTVNHNVSSNLIYIHGTALTETDGQLAAGFKKLFDVATPLLVASDVMRGTDSAALAADANPDIIIPIPMIPNAIDLSDTTLVRFSMGFTNAIGDLPTTAEITPGTITIDRKAIGGTSWINIVNAATCSELIGLIYYDEVFDTATGYAAGDSIRITFRSQKITVDANDFEITGTDGWVFQTYIREAMIGTNGANTTTPPTVTEIRTEMDDNSTKMAPSQTLADYKATGFSTHAAADIWSVGTRALTDKIGFSLSTAGVNLIWDDLISGMTQVGSIGKLIADNLNATITSRAIPNEYDTQMGYIPSNLDDVPTGTELNSAHGAGSWATATGFSTHSAANVWSVATRILTANTNFNDVSTSDVNTEVANALEAIKLDHLINIGVDTNWATTVHLDSVIGHLTDVGTTATFNRTTDSQEGIRNRGDAAWVTGGGGAINDILNIQTLIPYSIDLADTANIRIGLGLTNMVDDLPTTAEITPGTITIDRKAIGGTSWINKVNAAACSELIGLIYYDEVFDTATGYAAGDSIRITFKSQKITVDANDYEITGTDGWVFQTHIRESMVGTTGANTTTPPTVTEIRTEMDDNSTKMAPSQVLADYKATGFSTHSAANVWSVGTRALTDKSGFALSTAGIKAIWDQLTSALTTVGSVGKLIVDNINATISSRSPENEYDTEMARLDANVSSRNSVEPNTVIPDVAGTAATLHGITDGKIDVMDAIVDAIKAKTDNLPSGITKNEALPKFDFLMVLSSDHVTGATGKIVTGEISKDGGAFTAITNTITEVSSGMYTIASGFTQTEMNADVITLKFDETDCDTRIITLITT